MSDSLPNPGSYGEFVRDHDLHPSIGALVKYSADVVQQRQDLAKDIGVLPDDLGAVSLGHFVANRAKQQAQAGGHAQS